MSYINVAAKVVESSNGRKTPKHEQNLALFPFYNVRHGLLRFPAIIMPGVVFEFMRNDSRGVGAVQISQCPRKQAMSP